MKLQSRSPKGKALVSLIQLTAKHPAMLDKHASPAHGKGKPEAHEVPEAKEAEHGLGHADHEESNEEFSAHSSHEPDGVLEESAPDAPHAPVSLAQTDEPDLDTAQHDHEEGDCHDACPVRIAVKHRLGHR